MPGIEVFPVIVSKWDYWGKAGESTEPTKTLPKLWMEKWWNMHEIYEEIYEEILRWMPLSYELFVQTARPNIGRTINTYHDNT